MGRLQRVVEEGVNFSGMNGWQRLWLVGTGLAWVCFGLIYPLILTGDDTEGNRTYRRSIAEDFKSPRCRDYMTGPVSQLSEPPWSDGGGSCWHIYTSRKIDGHEGPSFNLEDYDAKHAAFRRWYMLEVIAVFSTIVLVVSGLVYFLGFLVAWIRRGFG
jgi:hypothetical protein